MRDIQVSRPAVIALIGAILVGGFFLFQQSKSSESAPPPPAPAQAAATGATGKDGATGASGPTMTTAELRKEKAKEARAKLVADAKENGIPLNVWEPLQQGKTVLIFFYTKGGQDDAHVWVAVDEVQQEQGSSLKVIREPVEHKSRYDGIAKAADITQTPGLLMMYGGNASTYQGYIDGAALNVRIKRLRAES